MQEGADPTRRSADTGQHTDDYRQELRHAGRVGPVPVRHAGRVGALSVRIGATKLRVAKLRAVLCQLLLDWLCDTTTFYAVPVPRKAIARGSGFCHKPMISHLCMFKNFMICADFLI